MELVLTALFGYLLGAVPTGYLVGKIGYGVDVRQSGSGNIGATNVGRVLGQRAGLMALAGDVLKGMAALFVPVWLATGAISFPVAAGANDSALIVVAAAAVICGNMFSFFASGKGVGVTSGVLIAMVPEIAAIELAIWLTVRAATKFVSLASLTIAVMFPALMWIYHGSNIPYIIFSLVAAALVFYSHRANLKRLIAGEELRYDRQVD